MLRLWQVAYVLGQMQHPATVNALGKVLADLNEHQMVRHEVSQKKASLGKWHGLTLWEADRFFSYSILYVA